MKNLLEQLINGLSTGSIYALIALGYTMVYGIAKMINFAHGDIIMVGAYALYVAVLTLHVPVIPAVLITIAVCAVQAASESAAAGRAHHRHRCELSFTESGASDLQCNADSFPVCHQSAIGEDRRSDDLRYHPGDYGHHAHFHDSADIIYQ